MLLLLMLYYVVIWYHISERLYGIIYLFIQLVNQCQHVYIDTSTIHNVEHMVILLYKKTYSV